MIDIEEVKKKLKTFQEYNTYIYVKTISSFYNGYVMSVHEDVFIFQDDIVANPFPVRFDELEFIPIPSNKRGKDFNFGREK